MSKHQEIGFPPWRKCYRVMKVLKAIQGQQPMVQMIGLDMYIHIKLIFFLYICSHDQYIVSNVNHVSQNLMKYCLNITHYVCKTGSRRLKLLNISAITATKWSLVVYLSESVKNIFLQHLLKVLFLIVCWLCASSGIWKQCICHF